MGGVGDVTEVSKGVGKLMWTLFLVVTKERRRQVRAAAYGRHARVRERHCEKRQNVHRTHAVRGRVCACQGASVNSRNTCLRVPLGCQAQRHKHALPTCTPAYTHTTYAHAHAHNTTQHWGIMFKLKHDTVMHKKCRSD